MPADRRFAPRPLGLSPLVGLSHGPLQGHRSAASGLVAATAALTLAAPLLGLPALASSPAAWAAYDARVRATCRAASQLVGVVERGNRLDLPTPGLSLLVLEGRYPQPHMHGQRGIELCVFEQSSGRASVVEGESLRRSLSMPAPDSTTGGAHPAAAPATRPEASPGGMPPARP